MPATPAALPDALLRNDWFRSLPPALQQRLAAAPRRRLRPGELIVLRGEPANGLYGVLEGSVRISAVTPTGKEMVVTLLEPGFWFGLISLFDDRTHTHDAHSVGDTELLVMDKPAFDALLREHPEYWHDFGRQLAWQIRRIFEGLEQATLDSMPQFLARRLLNMAQVYGEAVEDGTRIALHLPHEELARMVGAARQSVSKELKQWEQAGWLRLEYGHVVVRDRAALQRLCGG